MPDRILARHIPPRRPEALALEGLACVKFTATWCGPCHSIQSVYEELAASHPLLPCYLVDVDLEQNLSDSASIGALPTFVFLRDGAEVARVEGADKDKLRRAFQDAVSLEESEEENEP